MSITDYLPAGLFKARTVFVTGGSSGINLGIARHFAALGAAVGICSRKIERVNAAVAELCALGGAVFGQAADVRDAAALQAAIDECGRALGPIDVLVCGAAGNFIAPAEAMSVNAFKTVIDIDLLGSFHACHAAFKQLRQQKGCILFVSAGMSQQPHLFQSHVGAAKAGIDNLMANLALEWGEHGIRCNSIIPGPIAGTEGMRRLAPGEMLEAYAASIPMQRLGNVEDVANAAVFLASPLASYITGTVMVVDGGQRLQGSAFFNRGAKQIIAEQGKTK